VRNLLHPAESPNLPPVKWNATKMFMQSDKTDSALCVWEQYDNSQQPSYIPTSVIWHITFLRMGTDRKKRPFMEVK